jgi:hypothetical protein
LLNLDGIDHGVVLDRCKGEQEFTLGCRLDSGEAFDNSGAVSPGLLKDIELMQ